MPSDESDRTVLSRLARPVARFRSAVALTVEQVRGLLDEVEPPLEEQESARDLGSFAGGRIDASRFAGLLLAKDRADAARAATLRAVHRLLVGQLDAGDDLLVVRVEPGGCLRDAVARALARLGRTFGAARRVGLHGPTEAVDESLPYRSWNEAERDLAPPLVVHVDGADLHADGLAEFLDGAQKIVLLVRGETPPAPLVRLITPGTYVLQTDDETALDGLARHEGAGVAALLPAETARFVHDPARGATLAERLVVQHLPEEPPARACGGRSARQAWQELAQLAALTALPTLPASGTGGGDPVDALAGWLLSRADLSDLDGRKP